MSDPPVGDSEKLCFHRSQLCHAWHHIADPSSHVSYIFYKNARLNLSENFKFQKNDTVTLEITSHATEFENSLWLKSLVSK